MGTCNTAKILERQLAGKMETITCGPFAYTMLYIMGTGASTNKVGKGYMIMHLGLRFTRIARGMVSSTHLGLKYELSLVIPASLSTMHAS
jgi:hypothetical protein